VNTLHIKFMILPSLLTLPFLKPDPKLHLFQWATQPMAEQEVNFQELEVRVLSRMHVEGHHELLAGCDCL
jgi:hypothetical protein